MLNIKEIKKHLRSFENCHVLVVGDLMIDEYLWGHIERISAEAPVPILNIVRRESTLGGAGNVVRNLRALGAKVTAVGVVGTDNTGRRIRELIDQVEAGSENVVSDSHRKSTRKVRLMSLEHNQQVFRVDEETVQAVEGDIEEQLITSITKNGAHADVILCSDYLKGTLTRRVLSAAFEVAQQHGITNLVAPKDANFQKYRGATILMPNQKELAQLTSSVVDGERWLVGSARKLIESLALEALVVTRGKDGISLFQSGGDDLRRMDVPTMARSVFDVTGAGDTAISVLAASIAANGDLDFAVRLANLAAGIKVAKRGTNVVTIDEIDKHLADCAEEYPYN